MENNSLTKDQVKELIKTIKFLSGLEFGGLKFKSYNIGEDFITWNKNGKDTQIKFEDLLVKNCKEKTEPEIETFEDLTSSAIVGQEGGALSDTSSVVYSSKKISKNSDVYSVTSPYLNNMNGGGFLSDTSSVKMPSKSFKSKNSDVYSVTSPYLNNMNGGFLSDTSSVQMPSKSLKSKSFKSNNFNSDIYSVTSPNPNNKFNMKGGAYSETSSAMMNNYSETSPFNSNLGNIMGGGTLSETSTLNANEGIAYSQTSSYNPNFLLKGGAETHLQSDMYSSTSILNIKGGSRFGAGLTDTLESTDLGLSDIRLTDSLDTNIFKKPAQKGGSVSSGNQLKNKMKNLCIGSTSTSSICE